jgi:hypothetical protein
MPRKPQTTALATASPGVIEPDAVYTKEEFLARTGLKDESYLQAVRHGLRVTHKHKRVFIIGRDWIEYLQGDR